MTKSDLIAAMATAAGLTKAEAGRALQAFIDAVTGALKKGKNVTITGFGTFKVSKRAARKGVNPRTGAELKIPAMKAVTWRAGKTLKMAVRG